MVGGEPKIVRRFRDSVVTWASVGGGVVAVDLLAGGGLGMVSFFVVVPWGVFGILQQYGRLWRAGYSWRDVLHRPDAAEVRLGAPPPTADEFGPWMPAVLQARADRKAIQRLVDKLPTSERQLLPDVGATVDALLRRAEHLARSGQAMSAGVDARAVARLDERIAAIDRQPEGPERERQLELLLRQRQALGDLLARRQRVEEHIESCVLAMQNVRFDLLRLRSAGVAAVLDDLTHATQQARALSRDVDHAIAAAGEIRDLLGGGARD
jgi:serine/threonine-protein kinase